MLNLAGVLNTQSVRSVHDIVNTKFKDPSIFKTPESVVLFEQNYLDRETLLRLCNEQYPDITLLEPVGNFIPKDIIDRYRGTNDVPIRFIPSKKEVEVLYVPEYQSKSVDVSMYKVKRIPTTLHYYISTYVKHYGDFCELQRIPGKAALNMIIEEAIKEDVPDLTISNEESRVIVYYNKKKRKVMGNNIFPGYIMEDIIKVLTIKSPMDSDYGRMAKYTEYQIDDEYRARVVINRNIYGYVLSIRLFSNSQFNKSLEDININEEVIRFIRDASINKSNGLRLIVGETMSGKNTTALAMLREIVDEGTSKVVSIEMPVEQHIKGVEQIDTEYISEYVSNITSLIHQNPDFVYITETKDETAQAVLNIANTGKRVLTTLHSNSIADTISRITDITNLTSNRVIQVLHSIIHQELVNINDELYPCTKYVYFDEAFKQELYDKPFGEVIRLIKERERGGFRNGLL